MILVLSAVVLVGDDSGKRDVRETLPALGGPSMPVPDARRRIRQQRLYGMQRAGLPAIAETLLRDGVNERISVAQTVVLRRGIVGAAQSGAIYQFKVALIGITPPIWRRAQVTGDYTLAQLHRVLQVVMGWENYHLYMFRMGSKKYGPPDPDGVDDLGFVDAKRIRLAA